MKHLYTLFLLTFSTAVFAGNTTSTINYVQVNASNNAYIKFDSNPSGQPGCATDSNKRMTFSLNNNAGQAMLSSMLAAHAARLRVFASGTNSCNGNFEKISYMRVLKD